MEKYKKQIIGRYGEKETIKYLEKLGYTILAQNFITYYGEIDIVAKDNDEYVFIEVKTRTSKNFGTPRDAVNANKRKHIISSSKYFIYKYGLENKKIRFDIVEVYINKGKYLIEHIKNNFF